LKKKRIQSVPKVAKLSAEGRKGKEFACIVCTRKYKDTRSATHPENMTNFFATTKGFKGTLKREDILCKPCYSSFFTKKRKEYNWIDNKIEPKEIEMKEINSKEIETNEKEKNENKNIEIEQNVKVEKEFVQNVKVEKEFVKKEDTIESENRIEEIPHIQTNEKEYENMIKSGEKEDEEEKFKEKGYEEEEEKDIGLNNQHQEIEDDLEYVISFPSNSLIDTQLMKCKWIGEPFEKKSGKEFYSSVELEDTIYKVGDCARFKAPGRSFLGKISSLFQEDVDMYVTCHWYFFPEDIPLKNISEDPQHEVFESNLKDSNSVGSLESLSQVISEKEFKLRKEKGLPLDNIFFCKMFYNPRTHLFKSLTNTIDEKEEETI